MPEPTFASLQAELAGADYKVRKAAIKKLMRFYIEHALKQLESAKRPSA